MHALIICESLFGTNRAIAEAIGAGLGAAATATLVEGEPERARGWVAQLAAGR